MLPNSTCRQAQHLAQRRPLQQPGLLQLPDRLVGRAERRAFRRRAVPLSPGLIADDRRAARRGARAREGGVPRRRVEEQCAAGPARRADVVGQGRQRELSVELPAARKAFIDSLLRGLGKPVAARADRPVWTAGQEDGRSTRVARCLRRPPVRLAVEEVKHRLHAARPVWPFPKRQPIAMLHGQTARSRQVGRCASHPTTGQA